MLDESFPAKRKEVRDGHNFVLVLFLNSHTLGGKLNINDSPTVTKGNLTIAIVMTNVGVF